MGPKKGDLDAEKVIYHDLALFSAVSFLLAFAHVFAAHTNPFPEMPKKPGTKRKMSSVLVLHVETIAKLTKDILSRLRRQRESCYPFRSLTRCTSQARTEESQILQTSVSV